ncbi:MAG: hypothetical protein HRU09_06495 [Oligoflexales bacterium]|nr:hypothetical protein [Oligoflexales bacterium]
MHRCCLGPMVMLMSISISLITSCSNSASKKTSYVNKDNRTGDKGIVHESTRSTNTTSSDATRSGTIDQGGTNGGVTTSGNIDAGSENMALLTSCITSAESPEGLISLIETNCARCHTVGPGSAYFVQDNYEATCGLLLGGLGENGRYNVTDNVGRVFLTLPDQSRIVGKVQSEHNCWSADCEEDAAQLAAAVTQWSQDTQELRDSIAAGVSSNSSPTAALTGLPEAPSEGVRVNFVKMEAEAPEATKLPNDAAWTVGNLDEGGNTLYQMDANVCGTGNNGGSYAGNAGGASITFPLTVEQPGDYFLYISAASDAGNADSFFYAINNEPYEDANNPNVDDPAHQVEQSGNVGVALLKRASIGNNMNDLLTPLTGLAAGETVNVSVACREVNTRLDYVMLCQSDDPANCIIPEEETEYYLFLDAKNRETNEDFCAGVPAKLLVRFFAAGDGNYVVRKPMLVDPASTVDNVIPLSAGVTVTNLRFGVHDPLAAGGVGVDVYDTTRSGFNKDYVVPAGTAAPFAENAIFLDKINGIGLDNLVSQFQCEPM